MFGLRSSLSRSTYGRHYDDTIALVLSLFAWLAACEAPRGATPEMISPASRCRRGWTSSSRASITAVPDSAHTIQDPHVVAVGGDIDAVLYDGNTRLMGPGVETATTTLTGSPHPARPRTQRIRRTSWWTGSAALLH